MTVASKISYNRSKRVIDSWKARVYVAIKKREGGFTFSEMVAWFMSTEGVSGKDRSITSAMNDLWLDGYLDKGISRVCTVTGNDATPYMIAKRFPRECDKLKRRMLRELERRSQVERNIQAIWEEGLELDKSGNKYKLLPKITIEGEDV